MWKIWSSSTSWKTAILVTFFIEFLVLQWFGLRIGLASVRLGTPPYDHTCWADEPGHRKCHGPIDCFVVCWAWPLTGYRFLWKGNRLRWISDRRWSKKASAAA